MSLQIIIPTFRRMPRQATLGYLPPEWCRRTTLVLDEHDAQLQKLYDLRGASVLVHPPEITTIAKKRAWIIRQPQFGRVVMFDDDLRFAVRTGEGTKLRQATHADLDIYLSAMERTLDSAEQYVHAGWSPRQGNNNCEETEVINARMMFVLGYDCEVLRQLESRGSIKLGRIQTREDMDLTLQLLRLGYPNLVDFRIAADQVAGFAAKGGCSEERSLESSNRDAHLLASLHPGLVKVVQKKYKGSLQREEVVVQWKRAFEQSRTATSTAEQSAES